MTQCEIDIDKTLAVLSSSNCQELSDVVPEMLMIKSPQKFAGGNEFYDRQREIEKVRDVAIGRSDHQLKSRQCV